MTIDPQTGLPVDENGQVMDAGAAGSNVISDSDPGAFIPTEATPAQSTPISAHPAANIPIPGEQPIQSASYSHRGISGPQLGVVRGLNTSADRRAQADVQRFAPTYQGIEQGYVDNAEQQVLAARNQAAVVKEHTDREVDLYKAQAEFQQLQANLEAQAFAQSKIERAQYLQAYEHDLAFARQLSMMPADPRASMGAGGALGMMAQSGIQALLRVQGHNVDLTSQTERWVDQQIALHGQRVTDARQNAQGQLHLYDLARQKASDAYEARERYRGMVLEASKAQLAQEGARFGGALAQATVGKKIAEIDAALLGIKTSLADKQAEQYYKAQSQRITQAHYMAQDSLAAEASRLARDKFEHEKEKQPKGPALIQIGDTETMPLKDAAGNAVIDPRTKKPVMVPKQAWNIDSKDEHAVKGARDAQLKWATYDDRWKTVMKLRDEAYADLESKGLRGSLVRGIAGISDTSDIASRASEPFRRYSAAKREFMREQLRRQSGLVVPQQEVDDMLARYPDQQIFASGDGSQVFIDMREAKRKDFAREMAAFEYNPAGSIQSVRDVSPMAAADFRMSQSTVGPQTSDIQRAAAGAKEGSAEAVLKNKDVTTSFHRFMSTLPAHQQDHSAEPEYAVHLEELARIALQPFSVAKAEGLDEREAAQQALRSLERLAGDKTIPPLRRAYAELLAGRLIEEPEELANDLASTGLVSATKYE